jgi:hypothetical protein
VKRGKPKQSVHSDDVVNQADRTSKSTQTKQVDRL